MAKDVLFFVLLSFVALSSSTQSNGEIAFGINDLDLAYFEENGELDPDMTNMLAMSITASDLVALKNDRVCAANVGGGWQTHCCNWVSAAGTVGIFATNLANTIWNSLFKKYM
ncbi:hypothetical protein V2A60_008157 [Cordyceps javanica]